MKNVALASIKEHNSRPLLTLSHDEGPQTAVFTVRTHGEGSFKRWPSKEIAIAFLQQSTFVARQHFSKVALYTDSYGKYLFRNLGFDEIICSLDHFDIDPAIRSACKLDTYSRQKEPFIHMDWDFILWAKPKERFRSTVIAQTGSVNNCKSRVSLVWRSLPWKPPFIDFILKENIPIELPCPSILGGMDVDFLRWFSQLALQILRHPKNRFIQQMAGGDLSEDIAVAIEQWLLGACAIEKGITIKYLSDQPTHQLNSVEPDTVRRLGFTHLGGSAKHSQYWINEIQRLNAQAGLSSSDSASIQKSKNGKDKPIDLSAIPYKALISMQKHKDRRRNALRQFKKLGIEVEWKIPVKIDDIRWNSVTQAYKSRPAGASHALTLINILNEVESKKDESFMIFEDDVVFHPNILKLLPRIPVPQDWKFIYLGGRNCGIKCEISPRLTKSDFISDLHAVIIRSDMISQLKQVLTDPGINSVWLDFRIATLHNRYPAYLYRPNLAWQSVHGNDSGDGIVGSNYNEDGTVKDGQGD